MGSRVNGETKTVVVTGGSPTQVPRGRYQEDA